MSSAELPRKQHAARSRQLFGEASNLMPGGVSSPVRAFGAVGGTPPFIAAGNGCRLTDVDGNEYVDLVMSWGPLLHGHAHPTIVEAITDTAARGTSFGAPTAVELELAYRLCELVPGIEMIRFVNSGTEAAMSALRLARAYTGRDFILKFDGCYHGHVDMLLVQAGSGALTHGRPNSAGVPSSVVATTLTCPYNDLPTAAAIAADHSEDLAAIVVEPIAGNMGTIPPCDGFLTGLRRIATDIGAVLIFDEVITGFRVGIGGAQERYDVLPDLTCLGKIIGGGFPVGAYGGRAEIMRIVSPLGPVYQAGTLSGNPVAMAAGLASVDLATRSDYDYLESLARQLEAGLLDAAARTGVALTVNRAGSMISPFFTSQPVYDLNSARAADTQCYAAFFQAMLARGIYLPPSQFETWMPSFAHRPSDIELVLSAAEGSLKDLLL